MISSFITCNRPTPTLGETLDSYFRHFKETPYVFEEPDTPPYLNRTKVNRRANTFKLGCVSNWMNAVRWLYLNTQDDLYMICEDDISFRDSFNIPVGINSSHGYFSAYCSLLNKPQTTGWCPPRMPRSGLCGSLCLFLPRQSLEDVAHSI